MDGNHARAVAGSPAKPSCPVLTSDDVPEVVTKPELLFDMLNSYIFGGNEKLVPSLMYSIAEASSETITLLLKGLDLEDLCYPNAQRLRILNALISKSEDTGIDISLDWLIARDSVDQFNRETNEAICRLLGTLITHGNTADAYDVAVDYVDEVLATMEQEPMGMSELLFTMCLFADYAPDENDLSIWVNSYLMRQTRWLLSDWRLLHMSIRMEINDLQYEEIQQRLPDISQLDRDCTPEILAVMDAFEPIDRAELVLPCLVTKDGNEQAEQAKKDS